MDEDPVLRSLADDLRRNDPALAALLSGSAPAHHHGRFLVGALLLLPILVVGLLLSVRVTLGLATMLLVLASPAVACWLCATADDRAAGHP
jgi:hypothetical protein